MKLVVLLCTYNGGKYLIKQLESLYNQTYQDFYIYVHDDGSNDDTLKIITEYKKNKSNFFILESDETHLGAARSFMWLLENVTADYYMFCDQDDVWLPDKIECSLSAMLQYEKNNPTTPIVVNTDLKVTDDNLNIIADSFWKYTKIDKKLLNFFNYLCVYNSVVGCTMMINNFAKKISLPMSDKAIMHDAWIALKVKSESGVIIDITDPKILYRQHFNNTIGAEKYNVKHYVDKFLTLHNVIKDNVAVFKMVNSVRKFSVFKYIFYKLIYVIYRR